MSSKHYIKSFIIVKFLKSNACMLSPKKVAVAVCVAWLKHF